MIRNRSRGAFTLVELLVVIGIIAALISILLPVLARARLAAQATVCQSNLRQFGLAIQMYADQNKGQIPQKGPDGSVANQAFGFLPPGSTTPLPFVDDPSLWFNALPPFVGSKDYFTMLLDNQRSVADLPHAGTSNNIFICPTAGQAVARIGSNDVLDTTGNYYLLRGTDSQGLLRAGNLTQNGQFPFDMSYVWNSKLLAAYGLASEPKHVRLANLSPSSEVIVMTEKIANYGEDSDPVVQLWVNSNTIYTSNPLINEIDKQGFTKNIAQSKADWTRFTARHNHGGHLLFADGHVAFFGWTDVQYGPSSLPYNVTKSDANRYGYFRWSAIGLVNNSSVGG